MRINLKPYVVSYSISIKCVSASFGVIIQSLFHFCINSLTMCSQERSSVAVSKCLDHYDKCPKGNTNGCLRNEVRLPACSIHDCTRKTWESRVKCEPSFRLRKKGVKTKKSLRRCHLSRDIRRWRTWQKRSCKKKEERRNERTKKRDRDEGGNEAQTRLICELKWYGYVRSLHDG